ncbi:uncharacterized protein SPPG_06103 [Spizellomyces punctatus DAOM BR117]|uniref:NADP-dependent oxidoreductase domain-containing protein n=1 Tax=Spizellomyces punctatus (strain DAOM BR117) TaxID=645134 RepID=A0A0L0HC92_SPIPD|nr:uncharacterized protein SPPG_06103 [Spizellomyces punctatus DAOM BR117]KNC98398.1 hypothetical protein SPPG_06103 [Spizellomyces punctatus DAOM BR117]|eukprot:XP_016606438.1 hypothetical protein SPPG_06103 [Spizellomyces punctatus DAOM BR117]
MQPMDIPQLGLGTYRLKKAAVKAPLRLALECGYTMLDTASVYDNEKEIGQTLQTNVFITTKLWRSHQSECPKTIEKHLKASISKLGHVDLWLLHWPGPGYHRFKKYQVPKDWTPTTRIATWNAMTTLLTQTHVRAIGVSNFSIRQLQHLATHTSIRPSVNQIEMHPFLIQKELRAYCAQQDIRIMAYCSLGSGDPKLLNHPVVVRVANEVNKSVSQVLLRWAVQHGVIVIPCSTVREHLVENRGVWGWELSEVQMEALDGLDCGKRYAWKGVDPDSVP